MSHSEDSQFQGHVLPWPVFGVKHYDDHVTSSVASSCKQKEVRRDAADTGYPAAKDRVAVSLSCRGKHGNANFRNKPSVVWAAERGQERYVVTPDLKVRTALPRLGLGWHVGEPVTSDRHFGQKLESEEEATYNR
ncbi:hypothetical protein J6590_062236 [Homalodisca vitripennis]|nr:hypothetical protein J6590_062236 [Homalodisca vitripennis]